ncbi:MAG: flagellar biosynthetic protein FliR [Pseudomonadota bacterium]
MDISSQQLGAWVGSFVWPFIRIGAMLLANPVFGSRSVPLRVRIVLAAALTVMVSPLVGLIAPIDPLSAQGLWITLNEILIGLAMGLALALVFSVFVMAGEQMANAMGLGFASMVDPLNGANVPIVSQFLQIIAFLLFFALSGHTLVIELMVSSFELMPVGQSVVSLAAVRALTAWASQMFVGAALLSIPVIAMLLLVYVALGVMTRAAPQMNIFSVGFPLTILSGFVTIMMVMPTLEGHFSSLMLQSLELVRTVLGG